MASRTKLKMDTLAYHGTQMKLKPRVTTRRLITLSITIAVTMVMRILYHAILKKMISKFLASH
jgi:hypothetical protein